MGKKVVMAVNAGILSAECVLKTSKQVCNKVKNQIEGVVEANALQKIMASINTELGDFKPLDDSSSIPNQNQIENSNSQKTMDKEQEFAFVLYAPSLVWRKPLKFQLLLPELTH